jgi:pectate lyase
MMMKNPYLKMILITICCFSRLFANAQCSLVGWASQNGGVTGGGAATPTVVSTYEALKTAITTSSVKVVHISGTITIPAGGRISFQDQSAKTIYGLPGSKLVSNDLTKDGSGIIYVKRVSNVIFRNLTLVGPAAYDTDGWDNMTIDNSTNVWVDHCDFQDGMDGNLDIKAAADYISLTWCKFSYLKTPVAGGSGGSNDHRFSNLFGSSDGATGDRGHLRITLANCWWAQGCKERMPRVRFGKVHLVNNYFNSTVANKCIMAGYEADLLVEANVFENVKNPIDLMDKTFTAITQKNNIFTNTTGNTSGSGTAFTPPYTLTAVDASAVKALVTAGAGATLTTPDCGSTGATQYALTTTAAPAAGGTITGAGTYAAGAIVTLTATPASGYTFTGWSGAVTGTTNPVTVTMNAARSVTATFQASSTGGNSTIRIEDDAATGLCSYDGAISNNSGAANGKVINLSNSAGKGVTWSIDAPAAGTYALSFRYVNSSSSNASSLALIVNGTTVSPALTFAKTSNSTTFSNTTTTVSLKAGNNTIRLEATTASAAADIDWIEITGDTPAAGSCTGAKAATLSAISIEPAGGRLTNIYPNPTHGNTTINVTLAKNEQAVIRLFDAQGKLVKDLGIVQSATGGTQQVYYNFSGQQPGLYFVTFVNSKGAVATYKLVIE